MDPRISEVSEDNGVLKFRISSINVSLANAIRRVILSDIPTFVFRTSPYEQNKVTFFTNTSRMNNEILKQRLSCVPIHIKDLSFPYQNYSVILEETNDTDNVITLTTKDFKILNKETGDYVSKDDVHKLFPPSTITGDYISLLRLRPKLSEGLEGESIKLSADLDIGTAGEDGAFNVVSACSYEMTVNQDLVGYAWKEKEGIIRKENKDAADIDEILEYAKKDFMLLDAKRIVVQDSFDFIIETIGVYENSEIVSKACQIIIDRLEKVFKTISEDTTFIENHPGNFWMIKLENEDFTTTKILEYVLYKSHFEGDRILDYCASSRIHPHIPNCYIKLHFHKDVEDINEETISSMIGLAVNNVIPAFKYIQKVFETKE